MVTSHLKQSLSVSSYSLELFEYRRLLSATFRPLDGVGNNVQHASWGSTGQDLLRLAAAAYSDGIASPAGANRPSARAVSNAVVAHPANDIPNSRNLSAFAYLWGQFIDHDLDLTTAANPAQPFDIPVPTGDPSLDPNSTGTQTIPFVRSEFNLNTGSSKASPRQQTNDITAYLDGSMVYGSDDVRADALRTHSGGQLKTTSTGVGAMLPYNTLGLDDQIPGGAVAAEYYAAGDVRANENIELTAIQTLFVREHNRLAAQIAGRNPRMTDEAVYQQARRLVIGEIQSITYNQFLPALLGQKLPAYTGYKPWVNPGVTNEFSTAAFRIGHSLLANDVEFLDNNGNPVRDPIALSEAFFNPELLSQTGIDSLMKYLATSHSEQVDTKIVDSLRNFLFGNPGSGGLDLASLNIQRGRDHGLADYNTTRTALGLPAVTRFSDITSDPAVQQALRQTYGSVYNIDLWVGGLAENHVRGSGLGETFSAIITDQFTRVRDGDRFWYQTDLNPTELKRVENTSLADVIKWNTGVNNLQPNVFVFNVRIAGTVYSDANANGLQDSTEPGLKGWTVNVLHPDGTVVATGTTNGNGAYAFKGLDVGAYDVRLVPQNGWVPTTAAPGTFNVTRGIRINDVDFGITRSTTPVKPIVPNPVPNLTDDTGASDDTAAFIPSFPRRVHVPDRPTRILKPDPSEPILLLG